jgi:hypothetical protein
LGHSLDLLSCGILTMADPRPKSRTRGFSLQVDVEEVQMRPAEMASVQYISIPSNPISYNKKREFHDKAWSAAFAIGFLTFFIVGGMLMGGKYPNPASDYSAYGKKVYTEGQKCMCDNFQQNCGSGRRLSHADHHRFLAEAKSDTNMWSLMSQMPEVPATMIAAVISISIGWILALQQPAISRITVGLTLAAKVAFIIYLGTVTVGTVQLIFYGMAGLMVFVIYQSRAAIELSCKLISESACGLSANPGIVGTCVLAYLPYIGYVFLFMTFAAASALNFVFTPDPTISKCTIGLSATGQFGVRFIIIHFTWVTGLLAQIRLMIVSGSIGTWYFQGTKNVPKYPSLFWLKTALTTSGGSLTVGATVAAAVEWIKKKASAKCWCLSPAGIIARAVICCFAQLIMAITRMCTVVHVFTGDSFCAAKDKTMALLKRNFVGGVVTETISKMLFNTAGFLFSVALTCAAWAWFEDSKSNIWGVKILTGGVGGFQLYLYLFLVLFMVYDPILWVMIIGMFLAPLIKDMYFIIPLCAIFIGCIANMCFKYMAGVMMDATSAIFVSYAIDRENNTVSNNRESMRKILNSMPCMYSIVPLQQGAVAGQPVAMGVAVPMVTGPASDIEMATTSKSCSSCGKANVGGASFCAGCGAKMS